MRKYTIQKCKLENLVSIWGNTLTTMKPLTTNPDDMRVIASFFRVILNYRKMKKIEERNNGKITKRCSGGV